MMDTEAKLGIPVELDVVPSSCSVNLEPERVEDLDLALFHWVPGNESLCKELKRIIRKFHIVGELLINSGGFVNPLFFSLRSFGTLHGSLWGHRTGFFFSFALDRSGSWWLGE